MDGEGSARVCCAVEAGNGRLRGVARPPRHGATALGTVSSTVGHNMDHPSSPLRRAALAEVVRRHTGQEMTHSQVQARARW